MQMSPSARSTISSTRECSTACSAISWPPATGAGLLFEHLVVGQVLASAKARDTVADLSYFRTRGGYEVDLILGLGGKTYAVEIKAGRVDQGDAAKLESFSDYYKDVDGFFSGHSRSNSGPQDRAGTHRDSRGFLARGRLVVNL